ncbi:DNA-binding protein [Dyella tabacisoli]|uniref:Integrase n=1 Tax=Dyella tabacisoli TaxID=2282381 RepID=A0A369UHY5_9GAMM|nr:DNA-binding protein [Dyella tabacisoli]RDD79725.1 integrase [Dyella tabacisoli]
MPKGITQDQVNAAADALVATGDKPTVEKVRQALGTGSPNTVTRMLDAWRGMLALRMQDVIKLPELPPEVGQAFVDVWRLAMAHAEALARTALTQEQNALFAAQTDLTQERKLCEIALAEAQANVAEGTAKLAQSDMQWRERQALVDQLESQRGDLLLQRDRLLAQVEQQRIQLDTLLTERAAAQEHLRTMEDRAHQQVDHARQEGKALQQRLGREHREHAKTVASLTTQLGELRAVMRTSEQAASHHAGRATALEQQLARLKRPTIPSRNQAPRKDQSSAAKGSTKSRSKSAKGK